MCDVCLSFYLIILTVHTNTAQQTRLPAGWPTDKVVTMKTVTTDCGGPGVHSPCTEMGNNTPRGVDNTTNGVGRTGVSMAKYSVNSCE